MTLVLLFIPFFLNVGSAQQCKKVAYSVQRGYFLRDHLISTSNVKSIGQCLVACSQDQRCQSINFKFLGSICELNDADREIKPGYYQLNDGYAYSDYPIKVRVKINLYDDDMIRSLRKKIAIATPNVKKPKDQTSKHGYK